MNHARMTTRPGAYADSVRLMQVSPLVGSADGVEAALVAMAMHIKLDLAPEMGFAVSDATAGELLIAVRATDATGTPPSNWRSGGWPPTKLMVVLSKPPGPSVAERVRAGTRTVATRGQFALVGPDYPDLMTPC
jgi:hypothetical protein